MITELRKPEIQKIRENYTYVATLATGVELYSEHTHAIYVRWKLRRFNPSLVWDLYQTEKPKGVVIFQGDPRTYNKATFDTLAAVLTELQDM